MGYGIRLRLPPPASCFLFCVVTSAEHVESFRQDEIEYHCRTTQQINTPKSMTPAAFDPIFITLLIVLASVCLSLSLSPSPLQSYRRSFDPPTHSPQRCCGVGGRATDRPSIVSPQQTNPRFGDRPRKTPSFFPATPPLPFLLLAGPVFRSPPARSTAGHGWDVPHVGRGGGRADGGDWRFLSTGRTGDGGWIPTF